MDSWWRPLEVPPKTGEPQAAAEGRPSVAPASTAGPTQSLTVTNSANATVVQAGRDVVLQQPVIVKEVNRSRFAPPAATLRAATLARCRALAGRYPSLKVQLDVEANSDLRYKVADTLGAILEEARLGSFGRTNTYIGHAPGSPITVWCPAGGEGLARETLSALTPYLRVTGAAAIRCNGTPLEGALHLRIFVNGTPQMNDDGSVELE